MAQYSLLAHVQLCTSRSCILQQGVYFILYFYDTRPNGALVLVQSLGGPDQTNYYPCSMKCIQSN